MYLNAYNLVVFCYIYNSRGESFVTYIHLDLFRSHPRIILSLNSLQGLRTIKGARSILGTILKIDLPITSLAGLCTILYILKFSKIKGVEKYLLQPTIGSNSCVSRVSGRIRPGMRIFFCLVQTAGVLRKYCTMSEPFVDTVLFQSFAKI